MKLSMYTRCSSTRFHSRSSDLGSGRLIVPGASFDWWLREVQRHAALASVVWCARSTGCALRTAPQSAERPGRSF